MRFGDQVRIRAKGGTTVAWKADTDVAREDESAEYVSDQTVFWGFTHCFTHSMGEKRVSNPDVAPFVYLFYLAVAHMQWRKTDTKSRRSAMLIYTM